MKKISIIIMALALVMGMSQCKKNEEQANINGNNKTLHVRFVPNDNSKLWFDAEQVDGSIPVLWNAQDVVYVASNNKVVGYLYGGGSVGEYADFNGDNITIDLNAIEEGKPLQFFCLGAGIHPDIAHGDTEYVFNYADQSVDPAVVSYGYSTANYSSDVVWYECWNFQNFNSLVKFTVTPETTETLTIHGVKNEMTVRFDGTFENKETVGEITTFYRPSTDGNGIRYACVPVNQEAVSGDVYVGDTKVGTYNIPHAAALNRRIKGTITLD